MRNVQCGVCRHEYRVTITKMLYLPQSITSKELNIPPGNNASTFGFI